MPMPMLMPRCRCRISKWPIINSFAKLNSFPGYFRRLRKLNHSKTKIKRRTMKIVITIKAKGRHNLPFLTHNTHQDCLFS